ncbi:hypothetical protein HPB52_007564 [Rhipicephalus sanguineus]|uniref:TraB domain-containing protein n=1 Tax=Rhipicephalus sanguineus TaxID=34632 RepID=A0A9D4PLD4_RHISA|nr:hypothetical protein HPB52_007564 [Rhipicephalus sanguineus]
MGDSTAAGAASLSASVDKATGDAKANGPAAGALKTLTSVSLTGDGSGSSNVEGNVLGSVNGSPAKRQDASDSEKSLSLLTANGEGDHSKTVSSPEHFSTADEGDIGEETADGDSEEDSFLSRDTEDVQSETESEGAGEGLELRNVGGDSRHTMPIAVKRVRKENPELPETVTVLKTQEGSVVYLVGTAHFSLESQEDVAKTIQETQPDVVLIELCKSRLNILSFDEEVILRESQSMNMEKMMTTIKQNGLVQGIMYILLLSMSAHLTRQLGMAPGGEFRRAVQEAEKVRGCLIHLGDRPLQITLQRALAALSVWQKLRLAWHMITAKEPIRQVNCSASFCIASVKTSQPTPFVIVWSKTDIVFCPMPCMSNVNGEQPIVVVGVVGIGHVPGIVENWDKVSDVDIPPIMRIPEPSLPSKVLKLSIKASLLSLVVWGCWKALPPSITQKPIEWVSAFYHQ